MPPIRIILTVTNDLTYDQRMQRIAGTLAEAGYAVELVGRILPHSIPLDTRPYRQTRLRCRFNKGFLFYAEYNLRLFVYLLRAPFDAVGTVDLDTLPAGALASWLRRKKRVFDAHEYFTEVPEVTHRPLVKSFWGLIAQLFLPLYKHAYTVGPELAKIFEKKYRQAYAVVRNVPSPPLPPPIGGECSALGIRSESVEHHCMEQRIPPLWGVAEGGLLLYQGALNDGRGLETAIDAMALLEGFELWLAGEGDLSEVLRARVREKGLEERVWFLGYVKPADLKELTRHAWLGLNLFENRGLSYYYSLANKFFDYVQAGIPSLDMNFPEYRTHIQVFEVGVLLDELSPQALARAVLSLRNDPGRYARMQAACRQAAEMWNWDKEKTVLLQVWKRALEC